MWKTRESGKNHRSRRLLSMECRSGSGGSVLRGLQVTVIKITGARAPALPAALSSTPFSTSAAFVRIKISVIKKKTKGHVKKSGPPNNPPQLICLPAGDPDTGR